VNILKATSAVCSIRCGLNRLMSLMFRGLCLSVSVLNTLVSAAEWLNRLRIQLRVVDSWGSRTYVHYKMGGVDPPTGRGGSFGGVDGQQLSILNIRNSARKQQWCFLWLPVVATCFTWCSCFYHMIQCMQEHFMLL